MTRLIIAFTIILSSLTIAQTPTDLYILNKKIIPKIQTLTLEESQHIYDRLINYQTKTKTARQRFFLWSASAFLMQFSSSSSRTDSLLASPSSNPNPSLDPTPSSDSAQNSDPESRNLPQSPNLQFSILTGLITSITDGDTFTLTQELASTDSLLARPSSNPSLYPESPNPLKIRLLGIDTPERGEIGNLEATEYLRKTILNTSVTLITSPGISTDKYGRMLAYVLTASGTLLNLDLLEKGLARTMIRQEHPFIALFSWAQTAQNRQILTRRVYCTDFQTCDQARLAVSSWATYLDGDSDGLPCETSLCKNH
jgi:endonuclease YncB( thermonuclease family)